MWAYLWLPRFFWIRYFSYHGDDIPKYDPWVNQKHALFQIQISVEFSAFVKTQFKFGKVPFEVNEYTEFIHKL
jgi:hypothetical protein